MTDSDNPQQLMAPQIGRKIFGATLVGDGAGYYPGIELLNLVFSTTEDEILPQSDSVKVIRKSHDFARQLVWSEEHFAQRDDSKEFAFDEFSVVALRRLLECLQLEIPSLNKPPTWERAHFFPYTRSLIHWDARERKGQLRIERRYLRGSGAYAFNVLRNDQDLARLELIRSGFRKLYAATENGALEHLAATLSDRGYDDSEPGSDDMISQSPSLKDDTLEEEYRTGVANILSHDAMPSVVRIRSLIRWTGFWFVLLQHVKAAAVVGATDSFLVCDCSARFPQLRRSSQRCLKEKTAQIIEASEITAANLGGVLVQAQKNQIRTFFSATASTVGLLNALRGRRHFVLSIEMLEALVMASTYEESEITFERFINESLFLRFHLIVGRTSAEASGLMQSIDASVFEDNENHLARQMLASGFLTEYSDATRMVSARARQ